MHVKTLSKIKIKWLKSLSQKKYRNKEKIFIAEGDKLVGEILKSAFQIHTLVANAKWFAQNQILNSEKSIEYIQTDDLQSISNLKTPPDVLAIVRQADFNQRINFDQNLILLLDNIQDPGNMGTIIRTADWFGIEDIICTTNSVDIYNPKTIQATMGAITRVRIHYLDDETIARQLPTNTIVYGAYMQEQSIYKTKLANPAIVVLGNEGGGISESMDKLINQRISIPSFGKKQGESLNVSIACAIICSEFAGQNCRNI